MYQYAKIKKKLRYGREVKFYMEKKKKKSSELRYDRNLLAYFGIEPIT